MGRRSQDRSNFKNRFRCRVHVSDTQYNIHPAGSCIKHVKHLPPPFEPRFLRRKNARHDVPQRKSHAQTPSTHHGSGISTTRTVVDGLRELTCVRHCLRAMPFGRHAVAFRWRFLKKGAGQIKTPERSSFFQNGPLTIAEHRNSPGVG